MQLQHKTWRVDPCYKCIVLWFLLYCLWNSKCGILSSDKCESAKLCWFGLLNFIKTLWSAAKSYASRMCMSESSLGPFYVPDILYNSLWRCWYCSADKSSFIPLVTVHLQSWRAPLSKMMLSLSDWNLTGLVSQQISYAFDVDYICHSGYNGWIFSTPTQENDSDYDSNFLELINRMASRSPV